MRRFIMLLAALTCLGLIGCGPNQGELRVATEMADALHQRIAEKAATEQAAAEEATRKAEAARQVAEADQQARQKIIEEAVYPKRIADIRRLYSDLEKYNKNQEQYATHEEYTKEVLNYFNKNYNHDGTFIVKSEVFKYKSTVRNPSLELKIPTAGDVDHELTGRSQKHVYNLIMGYTPLIVKEFLKTELYRGTNIFGSYGEAYNTTGTVYGIFPLGLPEDSRSNILDYVFHIPESEISSDLKMAISSKNIEIFLICNPIIPIDRNDSIIKECHGYSAPEIDGGRGWSVTAKSIFVRVNAILICDKSKKKLLHVIVF